MKRYIFFAVSSLALLAACGDGAKTPAAGPNSEARVKAFKAMLPDFETMGQMVKGEKPYDTATFKSSAAAFMAKSQQPFTHFSQDGAGKDGNAKPEVWSNSAGFQEEQSKFETAVAALNSAAAEENLDNIKAAFGPVGASCKSCHEGFKINKS